MKRKMLSKISIKLILLNITAFAISIVVFILVTSVSTYFIIIRYADKMDIPMVLAHNIYSLFLTVLPIIIFIGIFLVGINKRVKYLNYIINSLKGVKEQVYLEELKLDGNDEITELASSINIMSNRLKENYEREKKIEQGKNDLIVAVSHDLKTPLTSIIGYLEIINKNSNTYNHEEIEYLNIAYEKSKGLKDLIDELFEYTKLANDYVVLEKSPCNMVILVKQVVGEYIPLLKQKNISVEIDCHSKELWCEIDVQSIIRVLDNIIKNAEKYSFENTELKVFIGKIGNEIKITFQNAGEHIAGEELEKIFDKMYRLDKSRNQRIEGSGLGLAISRRIIELHGGKIWAQCDGNIVKFNITLKMA
ncbi:sensor histidine kinase [Natronincola ferrireducens]|uniref:histidine kinase n=1 Tax=Natronincola ferrireducens TaxID=393762 RepID=A0A1G9IJ14_9FIRM|nr:HAMP domain-containing sensor histidine kinase [Natronincola ferrireducens]SDL25005.1 Signal transduction histidine kinase [Natronincola ferrireducens]